MIAKYLALCLLTTVAIAQFNYDNQGADWTGNCQLTQQSPIDLSGVVTTCDPTRVFNLRFTNESVTTSIYNTGESLRANGTFTRLFASNVNDELLSYTSSQFHFHAPSEHTVNGQHYEAEMHIVHTVSSLSTDDVYDGHNMAVIGIFFQVDSSSTDQPNPFWDALKLNNINQNLTLYMQMLLQDQLPPNPVYWDYEGSLTTPPCSQTVNWYILEMPLNITQNQIQQLNLLWDQNYSFADGNGNDRKTQPLNGRTLLKIGCGAEKGYFISLLLIGLLIVVLAIKF